MVVCMMAAEVVKIGSHKPTKDCSNPPVGLGPFEKAVVATVMED